MSQFFGILLFGVLGLWLMRRMLVKPILDIVYDCSMSINYMAMGMVMSGRDFWKNKYYMAREEFALRKLAVARIRKMRCLRIAEILMTPKEEALYVDFISKADLCDLKFAGAKSDYEKYGVQAQQL